MKKILVFTGTRAEYGLLYWLMRGIQAHEELELQVLVTGSHMSKEFGETINIIKSDGFPIVEKIDILLSSNTAVGITKSLGLGLIAFGESLNRISPDYVIILGDRFEALAIAQAAYINRIPIIHLHGGEVTSGAYDDAFRHAITKMASLHLVSAESHKKRVIQLGEDPSTVFNVGALGLDYLKKIDFLNIEELSNNINFKIEKPFFLVTYHPATIGNEDPTKTFNELLNAIDHFKEYQVIITYPNSDNGSQEIIQLIEKYRNKNQSKVVAIPSMGSNNYLSALKEAELIIGNSSSGIIEAPSLHTPTINVGVRQDGRLKSKSIIDCIGSEFEIRKAIQLGLTDDFKLLCQQLDNPYGSGNSTEKILRIITSNPMINKNFYDIN